MGWNARRAEKRREEEAAFEARLEQQAKDDEATKQAQRCGMVPDHMSDWEAVRWLAARVSELEEQLRRRDTEPLVPSLADQVDDTF
jgi:hypothetical protein